MIVAYIGLGVSLFLFVSFFLAIIIASILDWLHYRRNRLFIELERDYTKPRRPAAK